MILTPGEITLTRWEADVCIVGSGAGGAIAAAKIASSGRRVLLLEEGSRVQQEDLNPDATRLVPLMYRRAGGLGTDDMSIRILQGRVLGGSCTINWMTCLRTPDMVLDEWANRFGLEEYRPGEMAPHFEAVEQRLSVHAIPEEHHNSQNRIILVGARKLGVQAEASANNSVDCIGCGTCGLGCPYDAKQDMRLTYLADAQTHDTTILTGVRAERIHYLSPSQHRVEASILSDESSTIERKLEVTCTQVVVAASAIGTPLLLQHSRLNGSSLLGKYLHLHPVTATAGIYEEILDPTYGIPQSTVCEHYSNLNGEGYGFRLEVPDVEPFLAGVNFPGVGRSRRDGMRNMRRMGMIIALLRDGADRRSNGEVCWRRGLNVQSGHLSISKVPSIRYRLSPTDREHLQQGMETAVAFHFAAGAREVLTLHNRHQTLTSPSQIPQLRNLASGPNQLSMFSAHPTGTARMGKDRRFGVVDETMQMHHHPGIYVMDGSVLPTAPGVNPMITILATVSRALELGDLAS